MWRNVFMLLAGAGLAIGAIKVADYIQEDKKSTPTPPTDERSKIKEGLKDWAFQKATKMGEGTEEACEYVEDVSCEIIAELRAGYK